MLEVIYVVRHGYRSNWAVDHNTGTYTSSVRTPTGIPSDPALASYGVRQSEQLATHLLTLNPAPDKLYSSPYYRCLQTLAPYTTQLAAKQSVQITIEPGLGEFYGSAHFFHPSPAGLEELSRHFPHLHAENEPIITPPQKGESIPQLHDRVAFCLRHLIERADADPSPRSPRAILICTHAAAMISMGRVLTGRMPEEVGEEDFRCFTCGVSKFVRRQGVSSEDGRAGATKEKEKKWSPQQRQRDEIPNDLLEWRNGNGVGGGWECEVNSDCSFLENGEERGWNFWMEKERLQKLEREEEAGAKNEWGNKEA